MKVLVTGGAGFIGSHVVDCLVKENCAVRVLDDLSSGRLGNIQEHLTSDKVEFVKGDVRDALVVRKSLEGIDAVVHLAALISVPGSFENPILTFDVNLFGTLNLLRSCVQKRIGKFVFVSSCAVYGDPKILPVNENVKVNPISPYAESKLVGERYCLGFSERELLKLVVLRFFNVYGPRQGLNEYSGVITQFIDRLKQGKPLLVYGDGSQTRDFVNVKDIANAVLASLKTGVSNDVFNVGSGKSTSINELAKTVSELVDKNLDIHYEDPRTGDIKHSYADISKAKKFLGYEPKFSLSDGLRELVEGQSVVN
jgi:UDP-glucose 4-epimerase